MHLHSEWDSSLKPGQTPEEIHKAKFTYQSTESLSNPTPSSSLQAYTYLSLGLIADEHLNFISQVEYPQKKLKEYCNCCSVNFYPSIIQSNKTIFVTLVLLTDRHVVQLHG